MTARNKTFATNPLGEGLNVYRQGGWRGQYTRVRRWHRRLRTARTESDFIDFLYAFFQNTNHLADWVSNDRPEQQTRVEELVAQTIELRICRDICNATKHFDFNGPPKVPAGFADGREYIPDSYPREYPGFPLFFIAGGVKYDSLQLADRCMAAWDTFVLTLEPTSTSDHEPSEEGIGS